MKHNFKMGVGSQVGVEGTKVHFADVNSLRLENDIYSKILKYYVGEIMLVG